MMISYGHLVDFSQLFRTKNYTWGRSFFYFHTAHPHSHKHTSCRVKLQSHWTPRNLADATTVSLQNHKKQNLKYNQTEWGWNANNLKYTINKNMFVFCTKLNINDEKCNKCNTKCFQTNTILSTCKLIIHVSDYGPSTSHRTALSKVQPVITCNNSSIISSTSSDIHHCYDLLKHKRVTQILISLHWQ